MAQRGLTGACSGSPQRLPACVTARSRSPLSVRCMSSSTVEDNTNHSSSSQTALRSSSSPAAASRRPEVKFSKVDAATVQGDTIEVLRRRLRAIGFELETASEQDYSKITDSAPHQEPATQQPDAQQQNQQSQRHIHLHTLPAALLDRLGVQLAGARPNILPLRLRPLPKNIKPEGSGQEIILQAFNWESHRDDCWYTTIESQVDEIAQVASTVWLPPPTDSVSPQGYMPRDLYSLDSQYGSEQALISVVRRLQSRGIKVLGDAVLNHRCAHHKGDDGVYNKFGGRLAWDARAVVGDDPNFRGRGNRSTGDVFTAAPNIDHSQDFVKRDLAEWLVYLRSHAGFDGFRLDFVKGFHGSHVKDYMEASLPQFAVGEYWDTMNYDMDGTPGHNQDAHRQRTIDWINAAGGLSTAFDITTKGIMHAVFERCEYWRLKDASGKPPGLMGWWPSRAVTFVENHDTGSSQGHWRFPGHALEQGYAYILTHPGTPCVFYDHLFHEHHLGGAIRRLAALRQRVGLHCRSEVKILTASHDAYAAEIDGKVVVKIGPGDWAPDLGAWKITECGRAWAVWELKDDGAGGDDE